MATSSIVLEALSRTAALTLEEMQAHPSWIINAFDAQHQILFWNDCCARHFGISPEQAIGKKLEEVLPWVNTDEKLTYIKRALKGTHFEVSKVPFRMKSGFYEQKIIPVKDTAGNVIAALNLVMEQ